MNTTRIDRLNNLLAAALPKYPQPQTAQPLALSISIEIGSKKIPL